MSLTSFNARSSTGWTFGRLTLGEPVETLTLPAGATESDLEALLAHLRSALAKPTSSHQSTPVFPLATLAITYAFGLHLGFGPTHFHTPNRWTFHAAVHHSPASPDPPPPPVHPSLSAELCHGISTVDHAGRIEIIREGIRNGALYQANLAAPFVWHTNIQPSELYARGLSHGGADFAALLPVPDGHVVSFSPELFLRVSDRHIETRPIKGTRAILPGHDPKDVIRELLASTKDRAEHTMIVDLERNDLGRICRTGTIRVDPCIQAVLHPTIAHLESTITGTLRPDIGLLDILRATFPGGSITGAPKRAALEWIRRLEPQPRGIFCGALGWIDATGNLELALPIRTAEVHHHGGILHAGGGITFDSNPTDEWSEVLAKTAFFRRVLTRLALR